MGLDNQWREPRRHVTIKKDLEKMLRLTAELNRRRVLVEVDDKASNS
jgi:hypothetical protein